MTVLNNDKIQVIQEAIDSEKLLKCIQDMPEDRVEKAFKNGIWKEGRVAYRKNSVDRMHI